jgi:hypothetical protein
MSTGCFVAHLPRVAGKVVDAESGAGIEGAGMYLVYDVQNVLAFFGEPGGMAFDGGWTETDSEGRFEFPARWTTEGGPFGLVDQTPSVSWVHPTFGWGTRHLEVPGHRDIGNLEFRAARDQNLLRRLQRLPLDEGFCEGAIGESLTKCTALVSRAGLHR